MSITLSPSKQSKLLLRFLRHFSTEPNELPPPPPPQPQQQANDDLIITQAVQHLLQTPENVWNNSIFFSPSLSPRTLFQITHRLSSSSIALKFLQFLQSNSPSSHDTQSLSSTFQAVLELASHEPNLKTKLFELYNTSKDHNLPLTINVVTLLIRCFGRFEMVDKSVVVYNELDPFVKNTHISNVFVDVLLRGGCFDDALKMVNEMLEKDSEFPPNNITGILINHLRKSRRVDEALVIYLS